MESKCLLWFSVENVVSEQEDETEARGAGSAPSACFGHATAAAAVSAPRLEWTAPRPSPAGSSPSTLLLNACVYYCMYITEMY